ncbi:MAG: clostripain-related cysteine peptidase [Rikenellaceae bacterium]
MSIVLRVINTLLLVVVLASCDGDDGSAQITPDPDPDSPTPQTTIMYFAGTDLSSYYKKNILSAEEAVESGALGNGRFLYYLTETSSSGTLYELRYSGGQAEHEQIKTYSDSPSLDGATLTSVITEAMEYAPAEKYNLIMSSHATGWVLSSHPDVKSVTDRYLNTIWESTGEYVTRFLGISMDGYMDISDLRLALYDTGVKFGYIIFDSCFMSSVEALYNLRNRADYIVASPCEVMGDGMPYCWLLPELFEDSGSTADLEGACRAYYDYNVLYNIGAYNCPVACVALCVTSELEALAEVASRIYSSSDSAPSGSTLQVYDGLDDHVFYDLEQYILAMCDDDELKAEFAAQFDKTFPEGGRYHTDYYYAALGSNDGLKPISYYSGVTTSDPSTKFQDEWLETSWAVAIGAN